MDMVSMGVPASYRLPTGQVEVHDHALVCAGGPHEGLRVRLDREFLRVGRERWCDVSLSEDRRISREHCLLQVTPDGVRVRNLRPDNAIFLNDVRIQDAYMQPGLRLKLGETIFALQRRGKSMLLSQPFHDPSGQLVGQSESMRRLFALLRQLAPLEVPVLLTGSAGVGKRSVAKAIHDLGLRRHGPFVGVDLEGLASSWIEAYLFGYEAGAFPNAPDRYQGFFEQAQGGTLLLHEVTALPLDLQSRLLEVFAKKQYCRMGGTERLPLEIRLVSTSSRDVDRAVAEHFFLKELHHTLAVCEWQLPGLRQRQEDVALLVQHMLWRLAPDRSFHLTPRALLGLERMEWPGELAQLYGVLAHCVAHHTSQYLDLDDLLPGR